MAPTVLFPGMPFFAQHFSSSPVPLLASINSAGALTLAELQRDEQLTPDRFARYFRDFRFRLGDEVQAPEDRAFLAANSGDCIIHPPWQRDATKKKRKERELYAQLVNGFPEGIHGLLWLTVYVLFYIPIAAGANRTRLQ